MRQPNDDLEHALFTALRCTMHITDVCGFGKTFAGFAFPPNKFSELLWKLNRFGS